MTSVTIELTDYCPRSCAYCSSNSTTDISDAHFITIDRVREFLGDSRYETIILSGGEPLAHPGFYQILQICKARADDVVVYTNELTHIIYNSNIVDGIYVEANLTVTDETRRIHVLKRVEQGREARRPEVTFSKNFDGDCHGCGESVLLPDGSVAPSPCKKSVVENVSNDPEILGSVTTNDQSPPGPKHGCPLWRSCNHGKHCPSNTLDCPDRTSVTCPNCGSTSIECYSISALNTGNWKCNVCKCTWDDMPRPISTTIEHTSTPHPLETFVVNLDEMKEHCKTTDPCPVCGAPLYNDLRTLDSINVWCERCGYETIVGQTDETTNEQKLVSRPDDNNKNDMLDNEIHDDDDVLVKEMKFKRQLLL